MRWPSFFSDLMSSLNLGPPAVDLYLRVLQAIDSEVVDREIVHTVQVCIRHVLFSLYGFILVRRFKNSVFRVRKMAFVALTQLLACVSWVKNEKF